VRSKRDYLDVLRVICEHTRPRAILEWGPGESTVLLATMCRTATIVTLEHDPMFFAGMQKQLSVYPNVRTRLLPFSPSHPKTDAEAMIGKGYSTWPLRQNVRWDLVFIDGRSRCDCLTSSKFILAEKGVVVLDDAHRTNYAEAKALYPFSIKLEARRVEVMSLAMFGVELREELQSLM